ncbi:MAG: HzsA-related protein [Planctomycetota bacterium]|jgi:hypothetical protein
MRIPRQIACVASALAILCPAISRAQAPSYYQKKSTWRETIKASMFAKENPGSVKAGRRPERAPQPTGWRPVSSKVLRHRQEPQLLKADISGQPFLTLVANETRDGNGHDHAVWGDPKLTTTDGKTVWLASLRPASVKVGWGRFTNAKRKVSIGRSTFDRHIWAHARSVVCFKLPPGKYKSFEAHVGIDNKSGGGSVQFVIENKKVAGGGGTGGGGGGSSLSPLWEQLTSDFPAQANSILVARDWCRRERLDIESPSRNLEQKAREVLGQAKRALEYVEKETSHPALRCELKAMEAEFAKGGDWRELYLDVHDLRRRAIFSHPALSFDKILVNRNPPTKYSHNGDQHLGRHSRVGPGLTVLTGWKSGNPKVKAILEGKLPEGATRNPDLHYDANKVVFAFCDHTKDGQKRYFLYEAALDGSWVKQLTGTRRDKFETWDNRATVIIEDNDPCYLPDDDKIVFVSTRGQTFGRCHGGRYNPAWILHKCDKNGDNIEQLSFANENEYEPAVLNDGRIVFTRWEYTNRHEMLFHMLWWCRPDGSMVAHFYGNDTLHPMMVTEASAIPGTHRVVATAMGHHSYSTGTTVVLDINKGENHEEPVTHITPETPYSETKGWPEPHYSHPCAITEELFLVSRANHKVHKQGQTPPPANRAIYLVDPVEGRELIYEDPSVATFSPIAIRTRKRPPVLPSMLPAKADDWGTIFVQNAYLTRNDPEGKIKPGMIKAIRVNALGVQPRANRKSITMRCPNDIPKKVLGTVPVDADGTAFIKVPARTSLQMQTLDEHGMAILTEKSLFYLQPGENRSCVGCHEAVGTSPIAKAFGKIAGRRPQELKPAAGPQYPGGLSFMRTVQPVLDRYCIKCHGLEKTEKGTNLIHDGQYWSRSYKAIHKHGDHRVGDKGYMGGSRNISRPYDFYAYSNKTAHRLVKGHGKIYKEDRESYMRIIEWLDLNAQGFGDMFPNRLEDRKIDGNALKDLRAYAKQLFGDKIASQPDRALVNVAQPDESRILMAPLAVAGGGWGQIKGWKSKNDSGYKKMAQLVDRCIVKRPSDNVNGWTPTIEQGAGEKWVIDERRKYRTSIAPR